MRNSDNSFRRHLCYKSVNTSINTIMDAAGWSSCENVSLTRFKDWLLRFPRFISHDFLAIAPDQWLKEFQSNFNLSVCVSISLIRKYLRVTVGWSRLSSWLSIDELKSISITIHCCAKKILTQKNLWEIIRKNIKGVSGASGSNFQP